MYFFNPKGIVIPNIDRLNNYETEEGVGALKVFQKWGTVVYSVDSNNSILKTIRVFDGYMAVEPSGRAYKPGITKVIMSLDEFTTEYSRLVRVSVMDIKEVMTGIN
jgi:hypothetical protein